MRLHGRAQCHFLSSFIVLIYCKDKKRRRITLSLFFVIKYRHKQLRERPPALLEKNISITSTKRIIYDDRLFIGDATGGFNWKPPTLTELVYFASRFNAVILFTSKSICGLRSVKSICTATTRLCSRLATLKRQINKCDGLKLSKNIAPHPTTWTHQVAR